ncbi:hypothetical protein [Yinghuangia sp. YIM S09857]|uniref:hypothetical protein n=1 Tax=Yinghuangia sp. YIM S09857 TaxID=3436929 RepID=UPI003F5297B9
MTNENPPFELRQGWQTSDTVMSVIGLLLVAAGFVPGVPLGVAIPLWVLPTLFALLVTVARRRAPVLLRVDSAGVTFGASFTADVVVPWSDVEAVVSWRTKPGNWVGVAASQEYRERRGLGRGVNRLLDDTVGMPVSGTAIIWTGPDEDVKRFAAAAAHFAPDVPFVDPVTSPRRTDDAAEPTD